MRLLPKKAFLTKGVGTHKHKLTSFELALRDAGIAQFNLVRVSSIFPPHCKLIPKKQGVQMLEAGSIVHCVLYDCSTNEPHRLIAASVGVAIPRDKKIYGYLSEHQNYGENEKQAGDYAEDLAADMFATVHGVEKFDLEKSYDEKDDFWRISGKIVQTKSIAQSAVGRRGVWTTVLAGCIFIMD